MATAETILHAGPQYLALQNTLSETSWAVVALPDVHRRLQEARAAAHQTQETIRSFDEKSKYQLSRFNNLKHNTVKKAWYRTQGKLEEKLKQEEIQWLKRYEEVQAAKARGQEQDAKVEELAGFHNSCKKVNTLHATAKRKLDGLLETLFSGPTPSFPTEDELEQNLALARQRLHEMKDIAKKQVRIVDELQAAEKCLIASIGQLQVALDMNTYDMFTHGAYADWATHSSLAQARDFSAKAQYYVAEVRRLDPSVPHLGDMRIEQDNFVFNLVFDNIFTELRVREIIQESFLKIDRAKRILEGVVLPEVTSKCRLLQAQETSQRTEVARLEKAHWNERIRIMTEIVGGDTVPMYYTAPQEAPPAEIPAAVIPDEENLNEPPPPYSAINNRR